MAAQPRRCAEIGNRHSAGPTKVLAAEFPGYTSDQLTVIFAALAVEAGLTLSLDLAVDIQLV